MALGYLVFSIMALIRDTRYQFFQRVLGANPDSSTDKISILTSSRAQVTKLRPDTEHQSKPEALIFHPSQQV